MNNCMTDRNEEDRSDRKDDADDERNRHGNN